MARSNIEFTTLSAYNIAVNELEHLGKTCTAEEYAVGAKIVEKLRQWIISALGLEDISEIPKFGEEIE